MFPMPVQSLAGSSAAFSSRSTLMPSAWAPASALAVSFPFTHHLPDPSFILAEIYRNICLGLVSPLSYSIFPKAGIPHLFLVCFYSHSFLLIGIAWLLANLALSPMYFDFLVKIVLSAVQFYFLFLTPCLYSLYLFQLSSLFDNI